MIVYVLLKKTYCRYNIRESGCRPTDLLRQRKRRKKWKKRRRKEEEEEEEGEPR